MQALKRVPIKSNLSQWDHLGLEGRATRGSGCRLQTQGGKLVDGETPLVEAGQTKPIHVLS